jgi:peptidylprolyl isomerase
MRSSILLSSFSFSFSSAADTAYARRRRERGGRRRRARTAPKALFCRRRSFSFSSRSSSSGDDDENENENENENDDVKKKKKKTKNATKSEKEEEKGIWKSERKRREMLLTTTLTIQTRAAFALEDFAKREEKKGVSCVDVKEGGKGQLEENDVVSVNYALYLSDEDGTMGSKIDSAKFFVFGVGTGEVIEGFDAGLLGGDGVGPMRIGGVREVLIPPALAYGAKEVGGGRIPANSYLKFVVELVQIK